MLQLHTEGRGSSPGPAKAGFGRLSWEPRNWLAAQREGGRDSTQVSRIAGETMRIGESVSLLGSLVPSGPLRDRVRSEVYPSLTATLVIGIDRVTLQLATKLGENVKKSETNFFLSNVKMLTLTLSGT